MLFSIKVSLEKTSQHKNFTGTMEVCEGEFGFEIKLPDTIERMIVNGPPKNPVEARMWAPITISKDGRVIDLGDVEYRFFANAILMALANFILYNKNQETDFTFNFSCQKPGPNTLALVEVLNSPTFDCRIPLY